MLAISRVYSGGAWENNLPATPATNLGLSITTGGTPNTKTAYSEVFASVAYDVHGFWFYYANTSSSGAIANFLVDIAIGPGGSEQVIVPDFQVGWAAASNAGMNGVFFPIFIPKGTRMAISVQSSIASDVARFAFFLNSGASGYVGQLFSGCDTYGANTANSGGTAHTAGNSGAESTDANIGSATTRHYGAVTISVNGTNTGTTAVSYHWELTIGGTTVAEWLTANTTAEIVYGPYPQTPIYCSIPSGTQLQVQGECSGTAQSQEIAFHCFY